MRDLRIPLVLISKLKRLRTKTITSLCEGGKISNYPNLEDMQGSRSCLAPRERLPALLEPHAFDETRRHTIHRVKVIQPRVSKQRQASDTEQCVEHVHHVARPVRDPSTVRVLRGETFIAAEDKKTQTKEEAEMKKRYAPGLRG